MPGRKYSSGSSYRYGFNGKENDNDVKGEGNQQDYGMRIYDPRLGRFLSVDPIAKSFPWNSSYAFAENDVIRSIDLDGLEKLLIEEIHDKYGRLTKTIISGIRDINLKAGVEMDMMSALNIRLAKKDVYIIRKRADNSIFFEGNGGGLSRHDAIRIA
ncbi:MAG: RHS repeat-associated core domain-containing protein, partial [Ferruginibacter sp.]